MTADSEYRLQQSVDTNSHKYISVVVNLRCIELNMERRSNIAFGLVLGLI